MSAQVRADLLALDAEALAALTNRGLVKRAAREADRDPPRVSTDPDQTVVAEFSDGMRAVLPVGGLDQGVCSCGAVVTCRHLLGLIFAYQQVGAEVASDGDAVVASPESWSPGEFTEPALAGRIGARLVEAARRARRAGYTARVRRGATPVVELASATVRFLVPHDLGYVHTDARAGVRDDVIALAVWAFQAADAVEPDAAECVVDVGGAEGGPDEAGAGLEAVIEFAGEVLRAGVVHAGAGLVASAAGHLGRLERAGWRWPLDATVELVGQLSAYRDRSARYRPEITADLIAELFARHRAAAGDATTAGVRARVLGSEEAAETPLRRVRLDGLGARVTAVDDQRRVEIFHAQAATGVVLVSHRDWTSDADGATLARRRTGGATVGALAGGTLVTESAVRSASRVVRLATSRVSKSTVTVTSGGWESLPPGLLVTGYAGLAAELDRLPPRPVRARVRAELVRVLAIAEVCGMSYAPGAQRLTVEIRDRNGVPAIVTAGHATVAPGRLDAVAAVLSGRHGPPRFVAGSVHRGGGGLVIDPYALVADGPPIVPDLTAPTGFTLGAGTAQSPPGAASASPDASEVAFADAGQVSLPLAEPGAGRLAAAVAEAREVLADIAHSGLTHLPPVLPSRLREARQAVAQVGLHRVAAALAELAAQLGPDPGPAATAAWVDAYLRVGLAAELM